MSLLPKLTHIQWNCEPEIAHHEKPSSKQKTIKSLVTNWVVMKEEKTQLLVLYKMQSMLDAYA